MAAFNENSFWKQFEKAPVGTLFRHPHDGFIMKTGVGTKRAGYSKEQLVERFAKELHRRWSPIKF